GPVATVAVSTRSARFHGSILRSLIGRGRQDRARLLLGDGLDHLVHLTLLASADDSEAAGAELRVGPDGQAPDLVPAEPLDLEGAQLDGHRRPLAAGVVVVDR